MKYCQACGQPNQDDARFCEKCGAATAGGVAPVATQPGVPNSGVGRIGSVLPALQDKKTITYIAVGVGAIVVLFVLWSIFLKPMSATAYGNKADTYTSDIVDANNTIDEEIYNYSDDDSSLKLTESEWKSTKKAIEAEEKKIKVANAKLKRLRPPSDLKAADERILAWALFFNKEYLPALDQAMDEVEPGMTYERVTRQLSASKFLSREQQRQSSRGWSDLNRAAQDVDLIVVSDGDY